MDRAEEYTKLWKAAGRRLGYSAADICIGFTCVKGGWWVGGRNNDWRSLGALHYAAHMNPSILTAYLDDVLRGLS